MLSQKFKASYDTSTASKAARKDPPFRNKSNLEPWPRRLLHVPSMTSYERQSGNTYNGKKEPEYNAISYTWGRFEDKSEPPIKISGVTWKVPGINKSHFTVGEFQKVVETITNRSQFLWLDVACIDQENDAVKMDEVNKQSAIYRRAKTVYAWMVPWTTTEMLNAFYTVSNFHESLGFNPEGKAKLEPLGLPVAGDIASACASFQSISQQGWFTSLWTLQEGFTSRPFFLSRSADLMYYQTFAQGRYWPSKFPVGISWIAGESRNIWDKLKFSKNPLALSICQSVMDSGLLSMYFFKDPYLLYPASLKRYVSLPQDAVYAVMHVYGLHIPTMDDLDGLFQRLTIFLMQKDPVSFQIFLHQEPVILSDAWKISNSTHLPFQFFNTAITHISCQVEGNSRRRPIFTGSMTTLEDIISYWAKVQQQRRGAPRIPYRPNVFLDATQFSKCVCLELEDDPPAAEDQDIGRQDDKYTVRMPLRDIAGALPLPLRSYRILCLGSKEFQLSSSNFSGACYMKYYFGLLVRQEEVGKNNPWYRVGFCSWLVWSRKDIFDKRNQVSEVPDPLGVPDPITVPFGRWQDTRCMIG